MLTNYTDLRSQFRAVESDDVSSIMEVFNTNDRYIHSLLPDSAWQSGSIHMSSTIQILEDPQSSMNPCPKCSKQVYFRVLLTEP